MNISQQYFTFINILLNQIHESDSIKLIKEIMMDSIYQKIRKLRLARNLSQEALASLTGYTSRSSIAKIESGEVDLPQSKIASFAKALQTTPQYLLGFEDFDVESSESIVNIYGDHKRKLDYFIDKPELLELYKDIHESQNLQLLFDTAKDLTPQDLEMVLMIIKGIKKERGID